MAIANYRDKYSKVLDFFSDQVMEPNWKITHGTKIEQRKAIEKEGRLTGSPADNYSQSGALGNLIKDAKVIWFSGTLYNSAIPTKCPFGDQLLVLDWKSVLQQMGNFHVFFEDFHLTPDAGYNRHTGESVDVHYACFMVMSDKDEEVLKIAQQHLPELLPGQDAKVFSYDTEKIRVMINNTDCRVYVELGFLADSLSIDGGCWKHVQDTGRSPMK